MSEKYPVKTKKQLQLSDEERQKRRDRMIALRARLKEVKEPEPKPSKELEPVAEDPDDAEGEVEDITDTETEPQVEKPKPQPRKQPPKPKPQQLNRVQKEDDFGCEANAPRKYGKKPVKKKISIKYYGDVSEYEMMNDSKMLQGLHNNDYESTDRLMDKKMQLAKNESKHELMRKQIFGE